MPLSAGTRLGPYEIVALIGAGGMGDVYRASDPRLGRDVAIKVLPIAFSADADRLHRFEQEARAAAALNHPNILAVYDIGTEGGAPFIVSELLEGETLRERLTAGPVAARKGIEQALQIAHGLAAAHDKGIIHRDLKPENVFLTRDNRIKILDFGLAKLTQSGPTHGTASALATMPSPTEPGVILGTVGYMAPEQIRGGDVDHRADLFAFGAILYELLSGRRAFRRDTPPETMAAIINEDPPDLRAATVPIPPALARIVERCLQKNPSARFQTASDLAFALSGALMRPARQEPGALIRVVDATPRGSVGARLRCCWRRSHQSPTGTFESGPPRSARYASRFPRSSTWEDRETSASLPTAANWHSWGWARTGSPGSSSAPWIRWMSVPCPGQRHPRSRLRRSGLPPGGSSHSIPAANSTSWT